MPLQIKFRNQLVATVSTPVLERTAENERLFVSLFAIWARQQLEKERQTLRGSAYRQTQPVSLKRLENKVRDLAAGAIALAELPKKVRFAVINLSKLSSWYDGDFSRATPATKHFQSRRNQPNHQGRKSLHQKKDRWRDRD